MSPNTPKSAIVFLIISLALSVWLSGLIAKKRPMPAKASQGIVRAGFNKILSQVAWMRLIQYRGSLSSITKEDARVLSEKYDHLTNLDPRFERAYEEGALELGWQSPEDSLHLLDKAQATGNTGWRIPFLAGFIAKNRLNNPHLAIQYLEEAVKQPNHPSYVQRFLINLKVQSDDDKDPMKGLNLWVDYYFSGKGRFSGASGRMSSMDISPELDTERSMALRQICGIAAKITDQAQKNLSSERDPDRKKALQNRIDQTEKIIRQIYAGKHICPQCFRPYSPGDEFCGHDGKKLVPYGICLKCKTVVHGAYCQKCGTKNN